MREIILTRSHIRKLIPRRESWSHKGDFGKLLVIGGSRRYTGAPALAAIAAYRSGCDLVVVAAPQRAADIIASFSPDMITEPLKGDSLSPSHINSLLELSTSFDAVLIGNGLGKRPETLNAISKFLSKTTNPCVIDADAIDAVLIKKAVPKHSIITPHSHEFSQLSGEEPGTSMERRKSETLRLSSEIGTTILLKGHADVISDGVRLAVNRTGNPFMTKGGTGDILAGTCASFLSAGLPPFEAACAASYITGMAGDLAAKRFGPSLLASDVLDCMKEAMKPLSP